MCIRDRTRWYSVDSLLLSFLQVELAMAYECQLTQRQILQYIHYNRLDHFRRSYNHLNTGTTTQCWYSTTQIWSLSWRQTSLQLLLWWSNEEPLVMGTLPTSLTRTLLSTSQAFLLMVSFWEKCLVDQNIVQARVGLVLTLFTSWPAKNCTSWKSPWLTLMGRSMWLSMTGSRWEYILWDQILTKLKASASY